MSPDRCDLLCLDLPRGEELRRALDAGLASRTAVRARALPDPTRVLVATALRNGGELCVCDLSWIVERSQGLVSHHLQALRAEGLACPRRDGKIPWCRRSSSCGAALGDRQGTAKRACSARATASYAAPGGPRARDRLEAAAAVTADE